MVYNIAVGDGAPSDASTMHIVKHIAFAVLGLAPMPASQAQQLPPYLSARQALEAHYPDRQFSVWTIASGDLNGDGIDDLALIVTAPRATTQHDERLLVFAGKRDKSWTPLALSAEFCHARKFYQLDIARSALFVQGFTAADSDAASSFTLQFRYSARRNDLELIGREELSEEYAQQASYRVSTNYLSGVVLHERREKSKRKQARAQMPRAAELMRLNGFDCLNYSEGEPPLHINDDFTVSGQTP
jgi:hypothetical protein